MNELNISDYAYEKFLEFLKNKKLQDTISDMTVFMNATSIDDVVDTCLTMFLTTIEISKLNKDDLNNLKIAIKEIRSVAPQYPINHEVVPEPTNEFLKKKLTDKLDKFGYVADDRFKKMAGVK